MEKLRGEMKEIREAEKKKDKGRMTHRRNIEHSRCLRQMKKKQIQLMNQTTGK